MSTLLEKRNFYFNKFPIVTYKFGTEEYNVLDFLHRWKIRDSVKSNGAAYSKWVIRDHDTIRSIAKTLYESEHYYWIVMMMNDILDPFFGWPTSDRGVYNYTSNKYGSENIHAHHHWESEEDDNLFSIPPGEWVSVDYAYNKISISNYEHEERMNEAKRYIRLLKPAYLSQIKDEKEKILSSNFNRG